MSPLITRLVLALVALATFVAGAIAGCLLTYEVVMRLVERSLEADRRIRY